ncbi:MAG: exodeoxyribonuclease VII large subunit [Planctomycetota bacterium]|jgi:exodeoxyribonuclease VII large subunit
MTGTVELAPDGQHLLIRFPYREDLVAAVKDLPGRRWDPKAKVWKVPATHVEQVYTLLSRHLFEFASEIPSLLAGTLRAPTPPVAREPRDGVSRSGVASRLGAPPLGSAAGDATASGDGNDPQRAPALSVSELNHRIRDGLRELFPGAFWVCGEIVDFDKSAGRTHRFFQLVEKARGEVRPVAVVEVALFGSTAERLLPALERHEPPLTLRDGIEIRALVKLDFYPGTGRLQVVVQDIDPTFTLGKLALSREQVLRELLQLGLHERNRQLGFPLPALRIGVLTSPDADGWNDFRRHLEESHGGFEVTLYPVKVQGVELKPTLLAGLAWFAARADAFDVLCIVRGGGSRTDLAWFDDRDVALAVARHPLKIVVGIGHQRDQSVLDLIAHSAKTPTAVAELLVRGIEAARADVHERSERLRTAVAARLADANQALLATGRGVQRAVDGRLADARAQLAQFAHGLVAAGRLRLQHEGARLRRIAERVRTDAAMRLERAAARLEQQATRHRLLDPRAVLARGFTLVRDEHGKVLPSSARLHPDQTVRVHFRDGEADARVTRIRQDTP